MLGTKRVKQIAPSVEVPFLHDHPRVAAEIEKLNQLHRRRDKVEIELEGTKGQSPRQKLQDEAKAMIDGTPPPTAEEKPVRADLMRTLAVIDEAIKIQQQNVQRVSTEVCREIRRDLTSARHDLLSQIDGSVEALVAALKNYQQFVDDTDRADITVDNGIGVPWLSAAFGFGQQRWIVERLEAWRKEFADTGFISR